MSKPMNRRSLVAGTMASAPLVLAASAQAVTPRQAEGPFRPADLDTANLDTDLTRHRAGDAQARGEVIVIEGRVIDDRSRRPLADVLVELWQADADGLYNHPADQRAGTRDPNFQFWGRTRTRSDGTFRFRSVKPGPYPASADGSWWRPPHLHWRFMRRGFHEITTQTYFADEGQLNGRDPILQALSQSDQAKLVLDFQRSSNGAVVSEFLVEMAPA